MGDWLLGYQRKIQVQGKKRRGNKTEKTFRYKADYFFLLTNKGHIFCTGSKFWILSHMTQDCSVCILFEGNVFIFQSLNDKIHNYVFFWHSCMKYLNKGLLHVKKHTFLKTYIYRTGTIISRSWIQAMHKTRPCPFILILSWFYPDFI